MQKILYTICITSCLSTSTAQEKSPVFNLKDYKYRYQKYQGIGFNGGLSQDASRSHGAGGGWGSIALSGNYLLSQSTERWQQNGWANLNLNGQYNYPDRSFFSGNYPRNVSNFSPRISLNTQNKFYLPKREGSGFFVEGNLMVDASPTIASYGETMVNGSFFSKQEERVKKGWGSAELGVGKGRLELVTDAATAMFMLKDLEKAGCLSRPLMREDVLLLSQVITSQNNFRFFDTRMKRIRQLQLVDSVLQSRGLLKTSSIQNFAILNDNLYFTNLSPRSSGSLWSVKWRSSSNVSRGTNAYEGRLFDTIHTTDSINMAISNTLANALILTYTNSIPINLYWQRGWSIQLFGTLAESKFKNTIVNHSVSEFQNNGFSANLAGSYNLIYTPTTRSTYSFSCRSFSIYNFESTTVSRSLNEQLVANVSARRWISPRYQVHAGLSINANIWTDFATSYNLRMSQSFDAGFTYFLY